MCGSKRGPCPVARDTWADNSIRALLLLCVPFKLSLSLEKLQILVVTSTTHFGHLTHWILSAGGSRLFKLGQHVQVSHVLQTLETENVSTVSAVVLPEKESELCVTSGTIVTFHVHLPMTADGFVVPTEVWNGGRALDRGTVVVYRSCYRRFHWRVNVIIGVRWT